MCLNDVWPCFLWPSTMFLMICHHVCWWFSIMRCFKLLLCMVFQISDHVFSLLFDNVCWRFVLMCFSLLLLHDCWHVLYDCWLCVLMIVYDVFLTILTIFLWFMKHVFKLLLIMFLAMCERCSFVFCCF
jgi:hypothetical protein